MFDSKEQVEEEIKAAPMTMRINPYDLRSKFTYKFIFIALVGSVPYGLPCIALTRKTLDISLRTKQVEMINEKICKVMRHPIEVVDLNEVNSAE